MIKLDLHPSPRILDQFRWAAVVGLPLLGLVFTGFQWTHPVVLSLAGLAVLQLLLALTITDRLTWFLFVALSVVAVPIGFVVSHVLIALIYYLVFTPIGLFFRLLGRDPLHRRPDRDAPSYWHERGPMRPKSSYFKLY